QNKKQRQFMSPLAFMEPFQSTKDVYVFQDIDECEFSKEDLSDMVYTVKLVFNQKLLCSYDSRLEKYVGSDELGIRNAEHYNNQSWKMKQRKEELETICRANQPQLHTYYLMPPVVTVRSNSKARYGQLTTLECHAYNFYPQAINVTWLLDGSEVTGDVVSTEFMDNGDWSYQMHSYLELVLHRGVPVSCRVEHSGLKEPLVTLWGETRSSNVVWCKTLLIIKLLIIINNNINKKHVKY
uniref:Ig-like domain-containing protein n=1 Tax=Sinocyclocheilus anshuiensis TaxID=1608454 RepID=A0A671QRE7_9TELE